MKPKAPFSFSGKCVMTGLMKIPLIILGAVCTVVAVDAQTITTPTTYTSSGIFITPTGIVSVSVESWGGGGGGGGGSSGSKGGGGGGGGAYSKSTLPVTPLASYTVTVGTGGAGSTSSGLSGNDSWFGAVSTILAKGGAGGIAASSSALGGSGGASGSGIGTLKFSGGTGGTGFNSGSGGGGGGGSSAASTGAGGPGGNGIPGLPGIGGIALTGGGNGGNGPVNGPGVAGTVPGGAGGGGSGNFPAGNGASGKVIVSYTQDGAPIGLTSPQGPYINAAENGSVSVTVPLTTTGASAGENLILFQDGIQISNHILTAGEAILSYTFTGLTLTAGVRNITASVTNLAGNGGIVSAALTLTVDTIAPTVGSIVIGPSAPLTGIGTTNGTTATSLPYQIVFSESVTGLDVSDFSLTTSGSLSASVISVTGGPATYTVTVSVPTGTGTARLDYVANGSVLDLAGNASLSSYTTGGAGDTYSVVLPQPASHVTGFTAVPGSDNYSVQLSWTGQASGASGYLIRAKGQLDDDSNGSFISVIDGQTLGTDLIFSNGNGNSYVSAAANNFTFTTLLSGKTYTFEIIPYALGPFSTADNTDYLTTSIPSSTASTTTGSTGRLTTGATLPPASISSLSTTFGSKNFTFRIQDDGATSSADDARTRFTSLTIKAGTGNTLTSWSDVIAEAELLDKTENSCCPILTSTITANTITFNGIATGSNAIGALDDNEIKEYELRIRLKATMTGGAATTADGKVPVFMVDATSLSYNTATSNSSRIGVAETQSTNAANNIITVVATSVKFIQQPSNAFLNVSMSPLVTMEAVDVNGNRDLDVNSTVNVLSTGTLSTSPTASLVSGFGTSSAITHSVTGIALTLTTSNGLGLANPTSNTFNISASSSSDIIANTSFVYPQNIAYDLYQENANITSSATSLVVAKFDIRDGGGSADADASPTTLTSLSLDLGPNFGLIRRIAIYDATGVIELTGTEQVVASQIVNFSGFALPVSDNTSLSFTVRLSFKSSVTDNQNFAMAITSAVTQAGQSSTFSAANGGGASTSIAGDNNRIEVIATKLRFSTDITTSPLLVSKDISLQQSVPVVDASDAFNNRDLDYNSATIVVTNAGGLTMTNVPGSLSSGVITFASNFRYAQIGNGQLQVSSATLNASGALLTNATSSAVTVITGTATTITAGTTAPATISSLVTTPGAAVTVFSFNINDDATPVAATNNDGAPTLISQIIITANVAFNTITDWSQVLAGAQLWDGSGNNITATAIGTNTITFSGIPTTSNALGWTTDDGVSALSLKVWLKSALGAQQTSIDGKQFEFEVLTASITQVPGGTTVIAGQSANSGNKDVVAVVATSLRFTSPASTTFTSLNTNFPGIVVEAVDANLNRDLGFTGAASTIRGFNNATASATINGPTVGTTQFTNGLYSFPSNFQYTTGSIGNDVTLSIRAGANTICGSDFTTGAICATSPAITLQLSVPTATSATAVGQTTFTANWNTVGGGASGYLIDISTASDFSSFVGAFNNFNAGNVTSYTPPSGIAAGITYYYRVRANFSGTSSFNSNTISVTTVPANPNALAANGVNETSFNANWSSAPGATGYFLDVSASSGFGSFVPGYNNLTVSGTTFNVSSGLSANAAYFYRLRATSAVGTSGNSNTISISTAPLPPAISAATSIKDVSFSANWSPSSGATTYYLDVSTASDFSAIVTGYNGISTGNVISYSVNTNLAGNTLYYYRVRSSNGPGISTSSTTASLTTAPIAPTVTASGITDISFSANWGASPAATGYFLDVSTVSNFASFVGTYNNLNVGNVVTSAINSGLAANTTYYFRVRATNSNGISNSSANGTVVTAPAPPAILAASNVKDNSFSANWSASAGATGYVLDVSAVSNFASFIGGFNGLNVGNVTTISVSSGLTSNTLYYYRVRATGSGTSTNSSPTSVTTAPPQPAVSSATGITDVAFTANWSASPAATGYFLDVSTVSNFASFVTGYNNLSVGNVTNYVVNTNLIGNTTYYIRLRATNVNGTSNSSANGTAVTAPAAPTVAAATNVLTSSFNVNWSASTGATGYFLDVSTSNTFSSFLAGYQNLSVGNVIVYPVNSGVNPNIQYYMRVRASSTNGTSNSSANGTVTSGPPGSVANAATNLAETSFTANWTSSAGATGYLLDVSIDNFATNLIGYAAKPVAGLSDVVVGLQGNTTYQYRIRAASGSGTSNYSSAVNALTLPSVPSATPASAPLQNGFTANWTASGISSFKLDVSLDDFATRVLGYDDLPVSGTSTSISGLLSGSVYKYRLRASNASGVSSNSNSISVITVPGNPTASAASAVSTTGFTANWAATTGADSYLLDVATTPGFTTLLTGYNGKSSTATSETISGLSNGTVYYYRVRAVNVSGTSGSSNTVSQITIPSTPVPNTVDNKSTTSFIASWSAVTGADSYELDVTLFDSNFSSFVLGYNAKSIAGNTTESLVIALSSGVAYSFRVRAVNTGGKSASSSVKSVQLESGSGTQQVFSVTLSSFNNGQFTGSAVNILGSTANGLGTVAATLVYKGITESATKEKPITVSGGSFSIAAEESMLDELGMEFYVKVRDATDTEKKTSTERIYRIFSPSTSPAVVSKSFEGTRASIRIIAIPYELKDNLIESIFSSLGAYDKVGWRLAHYQEGQGNVEFREGINKIERGQGYWFNAKGTVNVKAGEGTVGTNSASNPFTLSLVKGWNQIGNPYPFAIDWSDILADNPGVTGVGTLKVYNGSKANYDNGVTMDAYTGGFVHADNAASLLVKVALKGTANGGRVASPARSSNLNENSWFLPLKAVQSNSVYDLGGIGMEPGASKSKDSFDEIRLPRLEDFLDITFEHPESQFRHFTQDIMPSDENATWIFHVESNTPDPMATLEWDNTKFGNHEARPMLLDVAAVRLIDMRSMNSYSFENPGKKEFHIYYNKEGKEISPDVMLVGQPYPNPAAGSTAINLLLPASAANYHVDISVIDIMGKPVGKIFTGIKEAGHHSLQWDCLDTNGSRLPVGIYLLRTTVNDQVIAIPTRLIIH